MPGLVAGVNLAKQVLAGAGRREKRAWRRFFPNGRADRDELEQVSQLPEIRRDARQSDRVLALRLVFKTIDGRVTAIDDKLSHAANLSPRERLQAARDAPNKTKRVDAVADDDVSRVVTELRQTVNLIPRQPRH